MAGPDQLKSPEQTGSQTAESALTAGARRALVRTREATDELDEMLMALAHSTTAFAGLTSRLSGTVISMGQQITQGGRAAQPFLPMLEQLAELTRASLGALKDLERQSDNFRTWVRRLRSVTDEAEAAVERLAAAATAPPPRVGPPSAVVVVSSPLSATERAARVTQLTNEIVAQRPSQRDTGPKN